MVKILGNRILLSKVEVPETDGFKAVEIQDDFVFKGKVEQIGIELDEVVKTLGLNLGDTVMFRKYSPDTEDVEIEGKKMKVVDLEDVIAII